MKLKNVKRSAIAFALSTTFMIPQVPQMAFGIDLFPSTSADTKDTGLFPTTGGGSSTTKPTSTTSKPSTKSSGPGSMSAAKVPEAYSCPLFENRPHEDLINAIDALSKEVKVSPECSGNPSARSLEENGNALKENLAALQKMMALQDPAQANTAQIDQSMTAALTAVGNLGDIVNNSHFLNSKCGRQTMSTGKVLLALNDVINGLAPYALFAVSMNAALAPALPFVIGGAIATSGISAVAKMIDQNTLDMKNPEHRKAVLQNTCQYTKVAKKVRFMQLAQSGKVENITKELEQSVDLYNAKFAKPTGELSALIKYRDSSMRATQTIEKQMLTDKESLESIEAQVASNNDDLMICTLTNELVLWAQDGKTFPFSTVLNLEAATAQGDRNLKLQGATMRALHLSSMKKIAESASTAYENEKSLKTCAQAGRSWISGIRQTINLTNNVVTKSKTDLENELSRNADYRQWKAQYYRIEMQKVTIQRVEKAMQELAKDTSIIDRSELAQRMVNLKSGLFGSRSAWGFGRPPVLAWIEHTKKIHDEAIAAFTDSLEAVRMGAFSLTPEGKLGGIVITPMGPAYVGVKAKTKMSPVAQSLSNLTLNEIPVGSREHEITCQQLETAWLDWSAAIDHLGAIQFFCDMVDPVLDVKMDSAMLKACRGDVKLSGQVSARPVVANAKHTLITKGFQADANLVSQKLKALQCPMPAVSVMNQ